MSSGMIIRALELSHHQGRRFRVSGAGGQGMIFESQDKNVFKHLGDTYLSVCIKPECNGTRLRKPQ